MTSANVSVSKTFTPCPCGLSRGELDFYGCVPLGCRESEFVHASLVLARIHSDYEVLIPNRFGGLHRLRASNQAPLFPFLVKDPNLDKRAGRLATAAEYARVARFQPCSAANRQI